MDRLNSGVDKINLRLSSSPLFYLSNDPERALGLEGLLNNYHIVFIDKSQYEEYFKGNGYKYFCLENYKARGLYRSSGKLVKSEDFKQYFEHFSSSENFFQTFKISPQFEFEANKLGVKILNTSASLNKLFEDKITQFNEISTLPISFPKSFVSELKLVNAKEVFKEFGQEFVVQFDRGHTGSGTVFIKGSQDFTRLQKEFPLRHVKISEKIIGRAYTLNGVVGEKSTYIGGLSAQITGVEGLTPEKGGTIGNDWLFRADFPNGYAAVVKDVLTVTAHMRSKGYRGLFGVDLILTNSGQHYIIEINARQPASIPMYTKMQILAGQIPLAAIHLMEFLRIPYEISQDEYNMVNLEPQSYSQVFIRPETEITINTALKMGVYALKGDDSKRVLYLDENKDEGLALVSNGFSIESIQQGGFLALTQVKGRTIKRNGELSRLQLKSGALDGNGNLIYWIKNVLLAIKDYQI